MRQRTATVAALALWALGAVACAGTPPNPADPWQGMNRPVFDFNEGADRWVLEPASEGWSFITTDGIRDSVAKFFYNLAFPSRFVSNVGQAEGQQAIIEVARFTINTTVGLVGFFDPATRWGLARRDEDIGQMFGRWGVEPGPYLVIPLLGPSSPRDAVGLVFDGLLSPFTWIGITTGIPTFGVPGVLNVVNARARADQQIENARRSALDYYVFVRDAYMQYREAAVANRGSTSDYGSGAIYEAGPSDDLYELDEPADDAGEEDPDAP
ncbi:MAG: VacJ-like lipoprotein [Proteobacteria bacterium]|nr:MAG: VacJ-like lipoprotein [Pseudomonadota bacterium]